MSTTLRTSAFVGCALAATVACADPIVIAHRGASGYLPEHTLEAYAMAYAMGSDYIEPDVVRTKDGVFICLHDIHLEGTTNVEQAFPDRARGDGRWYAADFTLAEVKTLQAHERMDGRFPEGQSDFEVPTLEEMIQLIQGLNESTGRDVGIYPELKGPSFHRREGLPMEEAFLKLLTRYGYVGPKARVFVQCFEDEPLRRMRKELGSTLPQIMLIGGRGQANAFLTRPGLRDVATFANGIGPSKTLIDRNPEIVDWAHELGLKVHPYTLRADSVPREFETHEDELHRYYVECKVDGLFTDFPDRARNFLDRRSETE